MRIVHIIDSIGNPASGPSYSVPRLCEALADLGHDVELHAVRTVGDAATTVPVVIYGGPRPFRHLGVSPGLQWALPQILATADIVHGHGVWMLPNITPFLPKRPLAKRVLSPRGMLLPPALAHRPWRKRTIWRLAQRRAFEGVDLFHATSDAEADSVRAVGFDKVVTIPNGIDLSEGTSPPPTTSTRTVLYLGRLHPIKGIDLLLTAWAAVQPAYPEWELVIAGPSLLDTRERLEALTASLGASGVRFAGPLYGTDKSDAYATAALSVLPSRSENFAVTVLEALAHGVPVVTTTGTPWAAVTERGCGWWVEPTAADIGDALADAMGRPRSELEAMGAEGRRWVAETYDWKTIATRMEAAYHTTLAAGSSA